MQARKLKVKRILWVVKIVAAKSVVPNNMDRRIQVHSWRAVSRACVLHEQRVRGHKYFNFRSNLDNRAHSYAQPIL